MEFVFVATMLALLVTIPMSQLAGASPYSADYDHGCSDAGISNADYRYINQPDKEPSNLCFIALITSPKQI
jgi:hypothetical protein